MEYEKYRVRIWKETFAIIKSKRTYSNAFANIIDKREITVIIEESKYDENDVIEVEKGYKILTFDTMLPFNLVGFIAKISKALAEENIPIFVISSYSTDHILIKEEYLEKAKRKLESMCFVVKEYK